MRLPFCYIAPQFSFFRRAAEKLYRAYGAVMSALWAGYVLRPLGAKFRCAARGGTFLWGCATDVNLCEPPAAGGEGAKLSHRAQIRCTEKARRRFAPQVPTVTPLQVLTKKRAGKTCALLFVLCSFYESTFALRSGWRLIAAWQLFMISASVTLYFSIMDATLAVSLRMSTTTTCS